MNLRQTNLALRILTVLLAAGAVLSLLIGFTTPLATSENPAPIQTPASTKNRSPRLPPIGSYTPVFARSLQTSTGGMAAAAASSQTETSSEPLVPISQLSLVGTIDNSVALIKGPDGTVGMVETGEDVNGSPVLAIRPSECDLRVNGKLLTLRLAPPQENSSTLR